MSLMTERVVPLCFVVQNADPDDRRSDILKVTQTGLATLSDVQNIWCEGDRVMEAVVGAKDAKFFSQ